MTLHRVWIPSPNYSPGRTSTRLLVVHTAEGASNIYSLGSFFANPASEVSSHVGVDDTPNTVGEYVARGDRAWTAATFNGEAVQAELCAFAAWTREIWLAHPTMLDNLAQWLAEEAARFGVPLVKLTPGEAQDGRTPGVCGHVTLGVAGGNHSDPGPGFPWDDVIAMANGTPVFQQPIGGRNMIASTSTGNGYWCVTRDGAVYAFGDAQFRGNVFDVEPATPGAQSGLLPGAEVVGIAGAGTDGYRIFASDGGVFCFGSAHYYGRPDRY